MGDIYIEGIQRIEFSKIEFSGLDSHHRDITITLDTGEIIHANLAAHDRDRLEIIDCENHPVDPVAHMRA